MRKFFLFAAALCCAVMINAQEIGTWSGFCKGAASFTFEGGARVTVPMVPLCSINMVTQLPSILLSIGHPIGLHSKH